MSFLIRAAFWLSLVILILPADKESTTDAARLSTSEAMVAAQATFKDFSSFCSRQPEVCAAGEVALESFSAKARYGAKQLYLYLDGEEAEASPTDEATVKEVAMNNVVPTAQERDQKALKALVLQAQ
ncbi:DUF5330 domain-containing protein [uncultured Cohaesibacter sp.]|uniref:DUF5330 domain-containing protein n=1 Tax=uncultured Cohaesibacter sp. TaxID=1002546 RepID=UPI0029C6CB99|nr:DUF5330 domain-containing protein [uncultured Cohaesibacter sp.]